MNLFNKLILQSRSNKIKIIFGVVVLLLIISIFSCTIIKKCNTNKKIEPSMHILIILDLTDGLTKYQKNVFMEKVNFVENNLKAGNKLSIYTITETNEELFSAIRPKDGTSANYFISNPKKLKKKFINNFKQPLYKVLNTINFEQKSNSSNILETIMHIGKSKEFKRFSNKKLLIFSNMLQNSESFTHYSNYNSINESQSYVLDVKNMLINTKLQVFILQDRKKLQNDKLLCWWKEYFKLTGIQNMKFKTI